MDKEPVVKADKTGEVLAKLPLARIGLACIALGLLLGGFLWYQTPVETTPGRRNTSKPKAICH